MPVKLGSSADALIAIDERGQIVFWNEAATRLLGREATQTLGRPCHEVMQGLTPAGGHLCGPDCPIQESCRELRAPRRFEMVVRHADGSEIWLDVASCIVVGDDDRPVAIHILTESVSERRLAALAEKVARKVSEPHPVAALASEQTLTRRELDVLTLLAQGCATAKIAQQLSLSQATVRNHVQNLLTKLGAHSRAEAVVLAIRGGLVHLH